MNELRYQAGFGNDFSTEAIPGALPIGRNSPQRAPHGLYAEQLSGAAFTAPRVQQRRSWLYRRRPSADHSTFTEIDARLLKSGPFTGGPPPNRLRWDPPPAASGDFVDGLITIAGNGDPATQTGMAAHVYVADRSMTDRAFFNADGEFLIVPCVGRLKIVTELGVLAIEPQEIAVIPRGVRFSVELLDGEARGYVCESYGAPFTLPERGPIGSNGLAAARDFLAPVAAEQPSSPTLLIQKFQGGLWATQLERTPFDVVAWHGNLTPYKYDLRRFNTIGTVSFDHPDPSIFTVLTSPSEIAGTANVDFVIFPPRWMVGEDTFRPPYFHRNVMSELMGLIHGVYDAKEGGFVRGGASLHNCMSAHGPDRLTTERAIRAKLAPEKIEDTLAFMFESRWVMRPTAWALETPTLQKDYDAVWKGF